MLAWYPPTTAHQPPQLRILAPPLPIPMRSQSRQDPPNHHHLPHPSLTSGPIPISIPPRQMSISPRQMSIPPPPPQMSAPPIINNHMHIGPGLHSPPQSLGPAQSAQFQFEQQHKVYQFQRQQEQHQQQQQQHQQQQQQQFHQHQHLPPSQHSQQQSWHNASVALYR